MINKDYFANFPTRRLKPIDGMAVTAEIWEEAHDYHRQHQRFHALLAHGAGIVAGLEVIASDPPDTSVYILPGIAVDSLGQTIVLTEPVAYDLGRTSNGPLYLLLSYGESRPRPDERRKAENVLYVHTEFGIEARTTLPTGPYVELARVWRLGREAPIFDAVDFDAPGPNELDLRFRSEIGARPRQVAAVAVSYVGNLADKHHGRGMRTLARTLSRSDRLQVWVDEDVPLGPGLERYTLVYLVGQRSFQLSRDEMNALYAYLKAGGTLFVETCRREPAGEAPAAESAALDLLASFGVLLNDVHAGHPLLTEPLLFAEPPAGFETQGTPHLRASQNVIFSSHDYGCLWQGEQRGKAPSRETIRAALEWGENLITFALERRRAAMNASASMDGTQ